MFENRRVAGEELGAELLERGIEVDVVLAVPRGGLPLGRAVADRLGVPLDIVAVKKLGAPYNPELAIGAAAADGSVYRNDDIIARLGVREPYVDRERERAAETASEKERTYRDGPPRDLSGERVVIVDDGLATGATALACVRTALARGAESVILAIPVAAADSVELVGMEADEVIALETSTRFGAVGQHYRDFTQVSDTEARTYLEN